MRGAIAFGSTRARLAVAVGVTLLLALGVMALQASPAFASGTVTVSVQGKGDVSGTGVNCNESGGPDCSEFYADTTYEECDPERRPPCTTFTEPPTVEFTAGLDRSGYAYQGWTGCDSVSGRICGLTVTSNTAVTARFADTQAPGVSGLTPGSGVQRGTITLGANASDNSGIVSRVEFRVRGALVGTDTTAPYSISYNTASVVDGSAEVRATAFDAAGNSSFITSTITIDNTPPTLTITSGPDGQTFGPGSTQSWTFQAGDATSGVSSVQCSMVPTGSAASFGPCSGAGSHSVTNKPEGDYTFTVRVRDGGGLDDTESRTFSIDATPPQTTITSGVADGAQTNQTSLTWDFSSSETGSSFECRVYPAALTPPDFAACSGSGTHTASGFSPGTYTFEVRATDPYGNTDPTPTKRTFTVDTTASNTTITSGPSGTVRSTSASFGFTASEAGSTFQCSLDGSAFASCSSPKGYANLRNGRHTFKVRAIDAAGNVDASPVSRAWTVDTIKPTVSGMSPRHTSVIRDTTPTIKATVKDNLTNLAKGHIKLYVNGVLISPTKYSYSASTDVLTYNSPRLAKGKKTVKIEATDAAKNVGTKSWYFTIK